MIQNTHFIIVNSIQIKKLKLTYTILQSFAQKLSICDLKVVPILKCSTISSNNANNHIVWNILHFNPQFSRGSAAEHYQIQLNCQNC